LLVCLVLLGRLFRPSRREQIHSREGLREGATPAQSVRETLKFIVRLRIASPASRLSLEAVQFNGKTRVLLGLVNPEEGSKERSGHSG
jgi:hypothetical protein